MRLIETLFSKRLNNRLTDLRPRLVRTALGLCGDAQQADDLVQEALAKALKVEVIANNEGLRILQQGRSPVAERVRQLADRYQNLMFAACGNTRQRFRKDKGEQIEILPQAVIVQSGVSFMVRRQKEGWAYIKV